MNLLLQISLSLGLIAAHVLLGIADDSSVSQCVQPGNIALTYDDGPGLRTFALLDVLDKFPGLQVTLHYEASQVQTQDGQLQLRRTLKSNHTIGLRFPKEYDYRLGNLTDEQISTLLIRDAQTFKDLAGVVPKYVRFYPGYFNERAANAATAAGFTVTKANLDSEDNSLPTIGDVADISPVIRRFQVALDSISGPVKGSFIAMEHSDSSNQARAAEAVINLVRSRGYQIVTLGECTQSSEYLSSVPQLDAQSEGNEQNGGQDGSDEDSKGNNSTLPWSSENGNYTSPNDKGNGDNNTNYNNNNSSNNNTGNNNNNNGGKGKGGNGGNSDGKQGTSGSDNTKGGSTNQNGRDTGSGGTNGTTNSTNNGTTTTATSHAEYTLQPDALSIQYILLAGVASFFFFHM